MATPFDDIDLKTAQSLVEDAVPDGLDTNRKFYNGDHWQAGEAWIGPVPSGAGKKETLAEIKRAFVSSNKVAEVVERHMTGVIGRSPNWSITRHEELPDEEDVPAGQQQLIDEAEELLRHWWNEREVHDELQEAVATLLWGERSPLRLYVPAGLLEPLGNEGDAVGLPQVPAAEAVDYICFEHLAPDQAVVTRDEDTKQQVGIFTYTVDENVHRAEVVYLDEGDRTVIRVIDSEGTVEGPFDYDFAGALTMFEMSRPLLITEQVRQNQKALNLAKTMQPRNIVLAGFLERVLLNAQLPGEFQEDGNGNRQFVPHTHEVGAGTLNRYVGILYKDADGNEQIAEPDIRWREPSDNTPLEAGERGSYRSILEEVDQLHALIAKDATASGESRRQARADFEMSLLLTKAKVEAAVRWLLETVLAMTAQFAGEPGRYAGLRATCECQIDTGPLSVEEIRLWLDAADRQQVPLAEALARIGVEDPEAMIEQLNEERASLAQFDEEQIRRLSEIRGAIEGDA